MQELNFNSNINSRCIVLRFVDFNLLNNYRIERCFTWKYESGWNEISLVIIFQELNINFRNVYIIFFVRSFYLFLLCFCWVFLIFLTPCLRILGYFYNIFLLRYLVCTCFFFWILSLSSSLRSFSFRRPLFAFLYIIPFYTLFFTFSFYNFLRTLLFHLNFSIYNFFALFLSS